MKIQDRVIKKYSNHYIATPFYLKESEALTAVANELGKFRCCAPPSAQISQFSMEFKTVAIYIVLNGEIIVANNIPNMRGVLFDQCMHIPDTRFRQLLFSYWSIDHYRLRGWIHGLGDQVEVLGQPRHVDKMPITTL